MTEWKKNRQLQQWEVRKTRIRCKSSSCAEVLWEGWSQNAKQWEGEGRVWAIRTESRERAETYSCVGWCEWGSVTQTLSWSASWADLRRKVVIFSKKFRNHIATTPASLHHRFVYFNRTVGKTRVKLPDFQLRWKKRGICSLQTQTLTLAFRWEGLIHTSQLKSQLQAYSGVTFQQICQREVTHFFSLRYKPVWHSDLPHSSLLFSLHHMNIHRPKPAAACT